jgi:cytochrome P450
VNLALAEMKVFLALFARRVDFDMTNTTPENVVSDPSSTVVRSVSKNVLR